MKLSLLGIFLEGLLSFLSPCVLPLLPLYMAYLSGEKDEEGRYPKKKVFFNTVFFVLGICVCFSLFALSIEGLKDFLNDYKDIISLIGGTLIILFGLHETGLIQISFLNRELSFKEKIHPEKMSFFKAFLFGFAFSFAWSPCIGPLFANALLLASTRPEGVLYIVFYAAGLILPFLLTGLFTSSILSFLQERKKWMKYVMILSGIILILYGGYMICQGSNNILSGRQDVPAESDDGKIYVSDTAFKDQFGNEIRLDEKEGKYVYLNFIASWCTYCKQEIPYYHEYAVDSDVLCYYVMSPMVSNEGNIEEIKAFINDAGITLPVLLDETGELMRTCGVSAFPTIMVVGPDGSYLGYSAGMLDTEGFKEIEEKAIEAYEAVQ